MTELELHQYSEGAAEDIPLLLEPLKMSASNGNLTQRMVNSSSLYLHIVDQTALSS